MEAIIWGIHSVVYGILCLELTGKEYHHLDIIGIFTEEKSFKENNEIRSTFFSLYILYSGVPLYHIQF